MRASNSLPVLVFLPERAHRSPLIVVSLNGTDSLPGSSCFSLKSVSPSHLTHLLPHHLMTCSGFSPNPPQFQGHMHCHHEAWWAPPYWSLCSFPTMCLTGHHAPTLSGLWGNGPMRGCYTLAVTGRNKGLSMSSGISSPPMLSYTNSFSTFLQTLPVSHRFRHSS